MKWITLTYLITPLLIGCTPGENNADFFPPFSLKDPLEENHNLTTTSEKSLHCHQVFKDSSEYYRELARTKQNNRNFLDLSNDHLTIAIDFRRFYEKSKNNNPTLPSQLHH